MYKFLIVNLCPCRVSQFSALYIISFVVITVGFIMFNAVPTYSALPEEPAEASDDPMAQSSSDHLLLSADSDTQRTETLTANDTP